MSQLVPSPSQKGFQGLTNRGRPDHQCIGLGSEFDRALKGMTSSPLGRGQGNFFLYFSAEIVETTLVPWVKTGQE